MVKVSFWTKLNLKQDLSYLRIQKKELKVRFSKLTCSMLKFPEQKNDIAYNEMFSSLLELISYLPHQ